MLKSSATSPSLSLARGLGSGGKISDSSLCLFVWGSCRVAVAWVQVSRVLFGFPAEGVVSGRFLRPGRLDSMCRRVRLVWPSDRSGGRPR